MNYFSSNNLNNLKSKIWKKLLYLFSYAAVIMCTVGGAFFLWRFYGRFGVKKAFLSLQFYFVLFLGLTPYVMMVWSHHVAGSKDPGYVTNSHKWLKESE